MPKRSLPREELQGGKIRSSRCIQRRGRHHLCCPTFYPLLIVLAPPMCFQIRCVNTYSVAVKAFREEQNVLFVVNENENMPSLSHCDEIPNARQAQRNEPRYPMSTSVGLHILTPPILLKNLLFNRKTVLTASESSPFNFSSQPFASFRYFQAIL